MNNIPSTFHPDTAKAKALYIGFNRAYLNPFLEMTLDVIGHASRMDCFGPGFSSEEELKAGVARWVDNHGPYDFVVTEPYVFEYERILKRKKPFILDVLKFPEHQYGKYAAEFKTFFMNVRGPKLLIGHWDIYAFPAHQVDELVRAGIYILGTDVSLIRRLSEMAGKGVLLPGANDNWYKYVDARRDRIISFPHFMNSREFENTPLEGRKYFCHIPGVEYAERKKAKSLLDLKARIRDKRDFVLNGLKWYFFDKMSQNRLDQMQNQYAQKITHSKICYSSGSSVRANVRKYFEIPAKGALMICQKCAGFDNFGFQDGHNCIVTEDMASIKRALDNYDEKKYQEIATRGRELVWQKHSEPARIGQLSESLTRILKNEFYGSYWDKGVYKFWSAR